MVSLLTLGGKSSPAVLYLRPHRTAKDRVPKGQSGPLREKGLECRRFAKRFSGFRGSGYSSASLWRTIASRHSPDKVRVSP